MGYVCFQEGIKISHSTKKHTHHCWWNNFGGSQVLEGWELGTTLLRWEGPPKYLCTCNLLSRCFGAGQLRFNPVEGSFYFRITPFRLIRNHCFKRRSNQGLDCTKQAMIRSSYWMYEFASLCPTYCANIEQLCTVVLIRYIDLYPSWLCMHV